MKPDAFSGIRAVALDCLLQDQIRTVRNASDYGAWGISTLDYCYLTTSEPRWTPGCGSITQTAWALLGLRGSRNVFTADSARIATAASQANDYVSNYIRSFLSQPEAERSKVARNRHAATALLADLLLAELVPERRRWWEGWPDAFETYARLLADLGWYLEKHGGRSAAPPSTEVTLLALYPLLIRTLLSLRANAQGEDGILHGLLEVWRKHASHVVPYSMDLLERFDARKSPVVSSPHVWAALLDATSIVAEQEDHVGLRAGKLRKALQRDVTVGLRRMARSPLPTYSDGSLWEPWGTLAVLVQMGEEHSGLAADVAEGLLRPLSPGLSKTASLPIIGGCTHIWSILVRRALLETDPPRQKLETGAISAGLIFPSLPGKFDYGHWPRDLKVRRARDVRALEVVEAWIRGGAQSAPRLLRRFAEFYRADLAKEVALTRNQGSRCRSVLLSGYTTSGKSSAAKFLDLRADVGRLVKRVTTASWNPGEAWEKRYYHVVSDAEFEALCDTMFGVHSLRGAKFAFSMEDFQAIPESVMRLLPVGWSAKALGDVRDACRAHGDEPLIVALKPSDDVLQRRIRQRWGGDNLPRQMSEAEEFYGSLPAEVRVIDSSGPKEEMFCQLLRLLEEELTLADGHDVVLSYAGSQLQVAEEIQAALLGVGIRSFVADTDSLPLHDAATQENINRVFCVADVVVVIWSRDYPMREFASYEWTTWITKSWEQDPARVVFVKIDGTPLPSEVRMARGIKWSTEGRRAVVDAVRSRLEGLNGVA